MQAASRQEVLEHQPTYWLKRSYQAMRRRVETDLRPFGLTLSQRDALLSLHHDGPHSHGSLAAHLGLEQSTVSRLVEGLAKRGLVEIREGSPDRRSRFISLTEHGQQILESSPGASKAAGGILASSLSTSEIDRLIHLLRRCADAWEGASVPGSAPNLGRGDGVPDRGDEKQVPEISTSRDSS